MKIKIKYKDSEESFDNITRLSILDTSNTKTIEFVQIIRNNGSVHRSIHTIENIDNTKEIILSEFNKKTLDK